MQAVVLLTFVAPLAEDAAPQLHEREQECGCCTSIPDAGHALFTTGVAQCFVHQRHAVR